MKKRNLVQAQASVYIALSLSGCNENSSTIQKNKDLNSGIFTKMNTEEQGSSILKTSLLLNTEKQDNSPLFVKYSFLKKIKSSEGGEKKINFIENISAEFYEDRKEKFLQCIQKLPGIEYVSFENFAKIYEIICDFSESYINIFMEACSRNEKLKEILINGNIDIYMQPFITLENNKIINTICNIKGIESATDNSLNAINLYFYDYRRDRFSETLVEKNRSNFERLIGDKDISFFLQDESNSKILGIDSPSSNMTALLLSFDSDDLKQLLSIPEFLKINKDAFTQLFCYHKNLCTKDGRSLVGMTYKEIDKKENSYIWQDKFEKLLKENSESLRKIFSSKEEVINFFKS